MTTTDGNWQTVSLRWDGTPEQLAKIQVWIHTVSGYGIAPNGELPKFRIDNGDWDTGLLWNDERGDWDTVPRGSYIVRDDNRFRAVSNADLPQWLMSMARKR